MYMYKPHLQDDIATVSVKPLCDMWQNQLYPQNAGDGYFVIQCESSLLMVSVNKEQNQHTACAQNRMPYFILIPLCLVISLNLLVCSFRIFCVGVFVIFLVRLGGICLFGLDLSSLYLLKKLVMYKKIKYKLCSQSLFRFSPQIV